MAHWTCLPSPTSRIAWGKWAALFSQTLLITVSLLPYMVARYQLGGAEPIKEAVGLVLLVVGSGVSTAAIIALSSQRSLILRLGFMGFLGVFSLIFSETIINFIIDDASGWFADWWLATPWDSIGYMALFLSGAAYLVYAFLSMGASRIATASENHSARKRLIAMAAIWSFSLFGSFLAVHSSGFDGAVWIFTFSNVLVLIVGMDVLTEDMPKSPAVAFPFMRLGGPGILAGRLLYPGWASGVLLYVVLCVVPLGILHGIALYEYTDEARMQRIAFYSLNLAIAPMVPVCLYKRKKDLFGMWCMCHVVLGIVAIFFTIFSLYNSHTMQLLTAFAPHTAMVKFSSESDFIVWNYRANALWLLVIVILTLREMRSYKKLEIAACMPTSQSTTSLRHDSHVLTL